MKLTYIFYATCECGSSIPVFVVICQHATADAGPCENLGRTVAGPHENPWDEPRKSQNQIKKKQKKKGSYKGQNKQK